MANEFRVKNGLIVHDGTAVSGVTPNANADNIVVDASGNSGITIFSGSSSTGNIFFGDGNSATQGQILYAHSSNSMRLVTAGSERVRIDSSGSVGIGETAPLFPLHLKYTDNRTDPEGSGSSSGAGAIGANAQGGGLYVENLSTTDGSWSGITFRTDTADARIAYKTVGSSLTNEGQMSFYLDANDTGGSVFTLEEVLRLRGGGSGANQTFNSAYVNGRLGVGTSSPQSLLEVRAAAGSPGTLTLSTAETTVVDGDKLGRIDFNAPSEADGTDAILIGASIWAEADATFAADNNRTELVFATGASEAAAERMRVTYDGKLGIGTSTPSRALDVNGDIVVRGNDILDSGVAAAITFDGSQNTTVTGNLTVSGTTSVGGSDVLVAGAQTAITTDFNTGRKVGRDTQNLIDFTTDNKITFRASNSDQLELTENSLQPSSDNSLELGDTASRLKSVVVAASAGANEYFAVGTTNNANNMALLRAAATPKFELFTWESAETTNATRVSMKGFHNSQGTHGMILKSEITVNTSAVSPYASEELTTNGPIQFQGHDDTYGFFRPIAAPSSGQMGALLIAKSDYRSELSGAGIPPQSQLEVRSPAGGPGTLTLSTEELTVVDGDKLGRIDFNAPKESDGTDAIAIAASIWAEADDTFAADNNSTDLVFATGASEAATEKMRLTHDGYLGIGTTTPSTKLHVKVADDTTHAATNLIADYEILVHNHSVTTDSFSGIAFISSTEVDNDSIGASIAGVRDTAAGATAGNHDTNLVFSTNDAGDDANTERMRITHDGLVGIGNTSPSQKLDVTGNFALSGNAVIGGDLTVSGTTTTLNTQTIEVEDNIIQLNTTQGSPDSATATTSGITIYRGDGVTQASFIFDDGDDTWDLTNNLVVAGNTRNLSDSNKTFFGADNDLSIFHDGSNAYIDSNTGLLRLDGNDGVWLDDGGSNIMRITNSSVLSYRGLDITGDTVHTGNLHLDADNNQLILGAGSDLKIYHDGSNSYIDEEGTGSLIINSSQVAIKGGADAAENMATFIDNGAVTLYHDNSAKLATTATGVEVTGLMQATTKSFDIEHPTKKDMRLRYGALEGPEYGVYHRGVGRSRVVDLPDYWTGLVDEDSITVQLTPRGGFQSLYVSKIEGNRVYVDSDHGGPLDFYFNVYGERKDVDKLVVEY